MKSTVQFKFGDRGIWKRPASERTKAKRVPAVVLEQIKVNDATLLYIFTLEKKAPNLTHRIATIMPSDWIPEV